MYKVYFEENNFFDKILMKILNDIWVDAIKI